MGRVVVHTGERGGISFPFTSISSYTKTSCPPPLQLYFSCYSFSYIRKASFSYQIFSYQFSKSSPTIIQP